MKTNQERAKIILSTASSTPEPEPKLASVPNRPVRPKLSWKMITALSIASVVFLGAIAGLIAGLLIGQRIDLDNMFITNFANYRAIGVGSTSNDNDALAFASYSDLDSQVPRDSILVGVDSNNAVEALKYAKDPNSESGKNFPNNLIEFRTCKNYSFVTFLDGYSSSLKIGGGVGFGVDEIRYPYLIDNKTGKIYSLKKLGEGIYDSTIYVDSTIPEDCESEDSVYFCNRYTSVIYRAYTKDNILKIEEVFDPEDLELEISSFFVDKYGNLFLNEGRLGAIEHTAQYLLKADENAENRFVSFPADTFNRCTNSIAYGTVDGELKEVDEHGDLVDTTFEYSKIRLTSKYLIKSTETEDYYYLGDKRNEYGQSPYDNTPQYNQILKITWLDEERKNFNFERIPLQLENKISEDPNFVATKDHLYISTKQNICKVEIATGKSEPLTEGYTFTSIETDNLGNVKFHGIDSKANKVIGIIDNDGKITVFTQTPKHQVYYIKPLF